MPFLDTLNSLLWGTPLLLLIFGTAFLILLFSRFAPVKCLFRRYSFPEKKPSSGLSLLQSSTASLAAAMGTGNLIGVAAALAIGGPGAIFWMWISALCGMILLYTENILACRCRRILPDGTQVSGAMAYLRFGLQKPGLAALFAVLCTAASFGMGNMTQSNAMAQTLHAAFRVPPLVTGILAAVFTGAVILGGSQRIGKFTQAAIPLLSLIYLMTAGVVIWRFRENLPHVFSSIFQGAFGISAAGGGICGSALSRAASVGLRRGVFSTEAGLGSSGILHGEAAGRPEQIGRISMLEACIDTFLCCTATALVILCTGENGQEAGTLLLTSFEKGIGMAADWILPPIMALFALCTLIGWSYCGASAFLYLTHGKYGKAYRIIFCLAAVLGAVMELHTVWTLADICNALMAYCNLPALLLLSRQR